MATKQVQMCLANQLTIVRPAAKAAIIRPKANAKANAKSLARLRIPRIPKILVVLKRFGWTTANYLRAGDSGYRIAWWLHHQTQSYRAVWMDQLLAAPPNLVADVVECYQNIANMMRDV